MNDKQYIELLEQLIIDSDCADYLCQEINENYPEECQVLCDYSTLQKECIRRYALRELSNAD